MSGVVTLAERHRREMERMEQAIVEIDARLIAYARKHGGRFIRYGSTAQGRMRRHSDVDIIADFSANEVCSAAASYAEELCFSNRMTPDVRPSYFVSPAFLAAAEETGVVLA